MSTSIISRYTKNGIAMAQIVIKTRLANGKFHSQTRRVAYSSIKG